MKKIILVIDDDPMNLRMASYLLMQQKCYEVLTASSGEEGLRILEDLEADLILLDIEMPVMDGLETFQLIMLEHIEIPVIFLTASGDKKNVIEALRLGAVDYITKPFVPEYFLERVARVFENE